MKKIILFLFVICIVFAKAEEEIISFNSDITIQQNGELKVVETIKVSVEGNVFQRGIYRALNTVYKAKNNINYNVSYNVQQVTKDGVSEPFFIKKNQSSINIYVGDENIYLKNGVYTYQITYTTKDQLGAYDEVDELYWNVTGNYWEVPIMITTATVHTPAGADIIQYTAYTGYLKETFKDYQVDKIDNNTISFKTTKELHANEGLTIAVGFKKDVVVMPNKWQIFLKSNMGLFVLLAGLLLTFLYYLTTWYKVGIDPPKGTIIPLFDPPKDLSPSAVRVINQMGYDNKVITAALINLAIKGYITIDKTKGGNQKLVKNKNADNGITPAEKVVMDSFFTSNNSLTLEQKNHAKISNGITKMRDKVKSEIDKKYYNLNTSHLIVGVVISVVAIAIAVIINGGFVNIFQTGWLSIWGIGVFMMFRQSFSSLRNRQFGIGIGMLVFAIPFLVVMVVVALVFSKTLSIPYAVILALYVINIVVFYHLLKAPTVYGRKVMDEIEGFQMYLKTAEKHLMERTKTKEDSIKLFERFLPYAVALNCETEWTKTFEKTINEALKDGTYQPTWHHSNIPYINIGSITNSVGSSLTHAVTSSSVAPTSSSSGGGFSGGGGGGFSGGGGGGGGGGGW
ncbi:MAG: DUF2207 domain-containing protein [Chitinophagales bacterium]|nr:DUF2207 domain-containing protein [Chitinophagales bacterium]